MTGGEFLGEESFPVDLPTVVSVRANGGTRTPTRLSTGT